MPAPLDHRATLVAAYVGHVTQAIVNNLGPLLFLIWHESFGVSFSALGGLVALNFGSQFLIDFLAPKFVDHIGYRASMVLAHVAAAAGLVLMGVLPFAFRDPFAGLVVAMLVCALGGGLLEVLVSPVVEACPTENKAVHMSILHSFYCWGHVAVVLLSALGFVLLGQDRWPLLCFGWALIPAANAVLNLMVPFFRLVPNGTPMRYVDLARSRTFWILVGVMLAAGASEQAMSQWASAYSQAGLGLDKTTGDLLGPALFATLMGLARVILGSRTTVRNVHRFMVGSLVLSVIAYLLAAFSPVAWLGLVGIGLGGFSVGVLWPGTFTVGSAVFPRGGTAMFALLALGGDAGCAIGPAVVGGAADHFGSLSTALGVGIVFPLAMLLGLLALGKPHLEDDAGVQPAH